MPNSVYHSGTCMTCCRPVNLALVKKLGKFKDGEHYIKHFPNTKTFKQKCPLGQYAEISSRLTTNIDLLNDGLDEKWTTEEAFKEGRTYLTSLKLKVDEDYPVCSHFTGKRGPQELNSHRAVFGKVQQVNIDNHVHFL